MGSSNFAKEMENIKNPSVNKTATAAQISTQQKVRCPPCHKPSTLLRTVRFCNKAFITGYLIYYTGHHGAWGTPEESLQFVKELSNHVQYLTRTLTPLPIRTFIFPDK